MSDRFPAGARDAVTEPIHRMVCASHYPGDDWTHTWRGHSGTSYHDFGNALMRSLNEAGFTITKRADQ